MPGRREELPGRRELDDAAEIHDADAIGDVVDDGEIVRDEQVGEAHALLQVAHQVQHLRLHRHVERRGRLVADQEFRMRGQRAGDGDALALAAGKLVRILAPSAAASPTCSSSAAHATVDLVPADCRLERDDRLGDDVRDRATAG